MIDDDIPGLSSEPDESLFPRDREAQLLTRSEPRLSRRANQLLKHGLIEMGLQPHERFEEN